MRFTEAAKVLSRGRPADPCDGTKWDQAIQVIEKMANERKHITQPEDWWDAFKTEADKQGVSLAEWLGEAGKAQLPKRVASKLSERPPANRPKKSKD